MQATPPESLISKESLDCPLVKTSEFFPCSHQQTIKHRTRVNCFTCGIFIHEDGVKSYKSQKMKYGAYFDPSRFYSSSVKQRQSKVYVNIDSDYSRQRNNLLDLVWETSQRLKLSLNTIHLAIYFMDIALSRLIALPQNLYVVYAATSVMLAAKSIELDERIPFISKLQRYSGLVNHKAREFAAAEQAILKQLSWNLQCVTSIDVLDYYFSQGVLFSNDMLLQEETNKNNNSSPTNSNNSSSTNTSEDAALKEKTNFNEFTPIKKKPSFALSTPRILNSAGSISSTLNGLSTTKAQNILSSAAPKVTDENRDTARVTESSLNNQSAYQYSNKKEKENGVSASETSIFTYAAQNPTIPLATVNLNKKRLFLSEYTDSRILEIVQKMEKDYIKLANLLIKDSSFYEFDIKQIAAACVCFVRKVNGIATAWNRQLSTISNNQISEVEFQSCLDVIETKYRSHFVLPNSPSTSSSLSISSSVQQITSSSQKRQALRSVNARSTQQRDSENKPPIGLSISTSNQHGTLPQIATLTTETSSIPPSNHSTQSSTKLGFKSHHQSNHSQTNAIQSHYHGHHQSMMSFSAVTAASSAQKLSGSKQNPSVNQNSLLHHQSLHNFQQTSAFNATSTTSGAEQPIGQAVKTNPAAFKQSISATATTATASNTALLSTKSNQSNHSSISSRNFMYYPNSQQNNTREGTSLLYQQQQSLQKTSLSSNNSNSFFRTGKQSNISLPANYLGFARFGSNIL